MDSAPLRAILGDDAGPLLVRLTARAERMAANVRHRLRKRDVALASSARPRHERFPHAPPGLDRERP